MSEHWPARFIGQLVSAWCNVCEQYTTHRIDAVTIAKSAGKLGPCMNHHAPELTKAQKQRREKARQKELFP